MRFAKKAADAEVTVKKAGWLKRHKAPAVILAILLGAALITGIGWAVIRSGLPGADRPDISATQGVSFIRTTTLTRGTLDDVVSATGTVNSANVSTVTAAAQNSTISEVLVQVGDKVTAGDVIARLDTSSLEEQIEKQEELLQKNIDAAQENLTAAQENADEAYDAAIAQESVLSAAQTSAAAAETAFVKVKATVAALQTIFDEADTAATAAGQAYAAAMNGCALHGAAVCGCADELAAYEAAKAVCGVCGTGEGTVCDCADELTAYEAAAAACGVHGAVLCTCNDELAAYESARTLLDTAQTNLKIAKDACGYDALQSAAAQAANAVAAARTQLDALEKAYSQALNKLDSAREQLENAAESDTLDALKEQLDSCILTASTTGTVTALNATVGSVVQGSIATIQDTENLTVSFTISDYDYDSVRPGQTVRISSDATDKPITGKISMLSPTASQSGSFAAECTVEGGSNGLYIGMSVSLEIVLSSVEDVYIVPYDAVGTDENGNRVIYEKVSGSGVNAVFEPVIVTTGAESDYYIEVSGDDLYEGMVIRAAADESEALTTLPEEMLEEAEEGMFDFGGGMPSGGFGGGMPSGGFGGGGMPSGGSGGGMPSGGFGGGGMPSGGFGG